MQKLNVNNRRMNNYLQLMHKSSMRIANILRKLREITHPKIQDVPLGMKMIEIQEDEAPPVAQNDERYVLVIEDEANLREIIQSVLQAESYKVILAESAYEGIDLFRAEKHLIELVILDFNLPDANGLNVLRQLQAIDTNVKVLLTSGFTFNNSIQEALDNGAMHFLRKPFNREDILDSVKKVFSLQSTV